MANVHTDCGKGDESGPSAPDCSCRGTVLEDTCARNGCGFCRKLDFYTKTGQPLRKDHAWGFGVNEDTRMPSIKDWRRLHRTMARHNWKQILVRGETSPGGALVFLAVPR